MQRAFVIRPFGKKQDLAGKEIDFEAIHQALIAPALLELGLAGGTTAEAIDAGNIREDMFGLIIGGDLVICDITIHNPNVFYELGIRHALRKKGSVMIKGKPVKEETPFDLQTDRYFTYNVDKPGDAKDDLVKVIRATMLGSREADSPVFRLLPSLQEQDPSVIQVVPSDLMEEIERAAAAKSSGWLRLLQGEVAGQLFRWPALHLVGQAQRRLKDYEGARETFESIRDNDPDDVAANLALADVYERLHRRSRDPAILALSNQAIARVTGNNRASTKVRAEALSLEGRNTKTVWRASFEDIPDPAARRRAALHPNLLKSYEPYREAYLTDLNHYYSALVALQMGTIILDLSAESEWLDLFASDPEAQAYKDKLAAQLDLLRAGARLAIEATMKARPRGDRERIFAEISEADLLFLNDERAKRVANAYIDAIPPDDAFSWDAARGQLQLFVSLGIKEKVAKAVMETVDAAVGAAPQAGESHVIVFAGHRIDAPGRNAPRFPATLEPAVRQKIQVELTKVASAGAKVKVFASGAPGGDVLCHEVCRELKIDSVLCLPMPPKDFASACFMNFDAWRARFLNLVDPHTLQLSNNRDGIPRWLGSSGIDPWERGNQWVLKMAQSAGANKVTAVALWDGKPMGDGRGGTAHFVDEARKAGIDVIILDLA